MTKDFDNTIVLTTQESGGFLTFRRETGDPNYYIIPEINSNIPISSLWINGLDISQDASIYEPSIGFALYIASSGDPSIAPFHVYTRDLFDFSYNIRFNIYSSLNPNVLVTSYDVSILNRPYIITESINVFENSNVQVDGETSYLLLRTNPKLSGNIKLVIDSSSFLYFDTFKVSEILSNKKFRKQQVSSNSVLSGDIRNIFSSLPLGEMYRLDAEDTLDVQLPKTDIWKQFNLNYSYGVKFFEDELYDDDYSILAPLWVNNTLPDYFAIFRLDGVYNTETYDKLSLDNLANKYFENSSLIKSWGMKDRTNLGSYLRNHLSELNKVISPLFLSLSDPAQKDPDPNIWYGITIDKGIIAGRSETTYFFDQKSSNFTDMNGFISEGFERLNLLCPNLLNLEFSFNDYDASLYSMHRYFGLYLTENPLYKIAYYATDSSSDVNILSLDGKDSSIFFTSDIFDSSGNISLNYKNRIFTLDDISKILRITNVDQVNGDSSSNIYEWVNKPGDNLFSIYAKPLNQLKPFFTIKLNRPLSQGEHIRFIDKTDNRIWEIYGINSDVLKAGEAWTYATMYKSDGYPTIYRTTFSIKGTVNDQITAIQKAWDVFEDYDGAPFLTGIVTLDSLSFYISTFFENHDIWFQRITAQTLDNPADPSSFFNAGAKYDDICFYGVFNPSSGDFERISADSSYGPINFELYGDRMSIMIKPLNSENYHTYSLDASIIDKFQNYMLYLCHDNWYRLIQNFDVSTSISVRTFQYVDDPTTDDDRIIVITEKPIVNVENKWNVYGVYPLTISLMGINPVKDFDYTIYDSSLGFTSNYNYKREGDVSTWSLLLATGESKTLSIRNSFKITNGTGSITINGDTQSYSGTSEISPFNFNTFEGSAYIQASSNSIITYGIIDGITNFKGYKSGVSEENILDYYRVQDTTLKYGLTVPYVIKWASTGNDCRNNPLRLILDASIFDVSTNFIPYENNFINEISYPSFKYLTPGERNWEDYIFYDINDVIKYNIDGSIYYATFKDIMLNNPYMDVFSKLVYSNGDVAGTKLRSSIVYYNNYKDSIDTIVNGLNLSFKLETNAKTLLNLTDWDRYRISLISIASRNKDNNSPIEFFINENTETILIVWYQGNDVLNYSKRDSTTLPGKSLLYGSLGNDIKWKAFPDNQSNLSHVKTPFGVLNSTASTSIFNLYDDHTLYDPSICSPFAQINVNIGDQLLSIFNAYDQNIVLYGGVFSFNLSFNTFKGYVDYNYFKNSGTYGEGIVNLPYSYSTNSNFYKDKTCNLDILKYIFNRNNIKYYIFHGDTILTNADFVVNPLIISINEPRTYKGVTTYNGWYVPQFYNILNFNYNEEKYLIDTVSKDFTSGNTYIRSYSNIPQYWYNKVVEQMTAYDVSVKNAINYISGFNVFKSLWDKDYYKISDTGVETPIAGYQSSLELPSFFGSKVTSLPGTLTLEEWDNTTARYTLTEERLVLNFNLTRSILNLFKNEGIFTSNWLGLTGADNIINDYIKTTILNYYNISKPKITVELWSKPNRTNEIPISYILDNTFIKIEGTNIEGNLNYINNEYIYRIDLNVNPKQQYFVKFILFEK